MGDQPLIVWALVAIGVLAIPMTATWALFRGGVETGFGRRTVWLIAGAGVHVFAAWITASALLAGTGVYRDGAGGVAPWFGVAAAAALVAFLAATGSRSCRGSSTSRGRCHALPGRTRSGWWARRS